MPEIRTATAADLVLLPQVEAASDTLLCGRPEIRGDLVGALPDPAGPRELAAARKVLVSGQPPVAFVRVEEVGGCAHLEQLSVHPAAAQAGLGRALVAAAIEWSREALTLCTFARIPFNAPFYRSCGFAVVEPSGELAQVRKHEADLGLDRIGERVARRIELTVPHADGGTTGN
ncbi:GNAT family N-acetyltransferase [Arthrobacter gandavensis]|uniref:GNAT family N-acetyltransferase n=1 Tax=Arthrobacter gandavensis TaxID=169960 RepID=UPI00188F29AF|nr:GNAT family N-acetyltransferase [Arthrobacter gandavensis]MBF4995488.1 GNAT family N-acetyltransferase [Arthrobacter gandavensis]